MFNLILEAAFLSRRGAKCGGERSTISSPTFSPPLFPLPSWSSWKHLSSWAMITLKLNKHLFLWGYPKTSHTPSCHSHSHSWANSTKLNCFELYDMMIWSCNKYIYWQISMIERVICINYIIYFVMDVLSLALSFVNHASISRDKYWW